MVRPEEVQHGMAISLVLELIKTMKERLLILFLLVNISCATPSFHYINNNINTGVDLKNGKWLLNNIEASYPLNKELHKIINGYFVSKLGKRLFCINNVKSLYLNDKDLTSSKSKMIALYKETNIHFFICASAKVLKKEFDAIDTTNHRFKNSEKENKVQVEINIYDLKNGEVLFKKTLVGTTVLQQNNSDINLTTSNDFMIKKGIKKIIKELDKKSIK